MTILTNGKLKAYITSRTFLFQLHLLLAKRTTDSVIIVGTFKEVLHASHHRFVSLCRRPGNFGFELRLSPRLKARNHLSALILYKYTYALTSFVARRFWKIFQIPHWLITLMEEWYSNQRSRHVPRIHYSIQSKLLCWTMQVGIGIFTFFCQRWIRVFFCEWESATFEKSQKNHRQAVRISSMFHDKYQNHNGNRIWMNKEITTYVMVKLTM